MRSPFLIATVLAGLAPFASASQTHSVELKPGAPVEVSLESFCDLKPSHGYMPVKVTLRNDTDSALSYRLEYAPSNSFEREGRVSGSAELRVAPGSRASTIVYAPVLPARYTGSTTFRLTGPGIRRGEFMLHSRNGYSSSSVNYGHTGMGERFAMRHSGAIEAAAKSAGWHNPLPFTKIGSAFAPADRRAYDSFCSIWLDESEWESIEPAAQSAIREWVSLGGRLHLVSSAGEQSAEPLGFGEISRVAVGEDETRFAERVAKRLAAIKSPSSRMDEGESRLFSRFAAAATERPVALLIVLVAFALVIGPVNLFVFAKPPHRHRLLWTTPLISGVAALLLFISILLIDGTGGSGRRFTLVALEPGLKRAAVWQQQISRSGLLFRRSFDFDSADYLMPIHEASARSREGAYEKTDTGWSGDWFAGRSVRAQAVFATQTVRGGIELTTGDSPCVVSSLESPLSEILIIDSQGAAYSARDLLPGVRRPLTPVAGGGDAALAAWRKPLESAGETLWDASPSKPVVGARFYAKASRGAPFVRETLPTLRWSDDVTLVFGPVSPARAE